MYNASVFLRNSQCNYDTLQFYSNNPHNPQFYNQSPHSQYKNHDYNRGTNRQMSYELALNQRKTDTEFFTNFINANAAIERSKAGSTRKLSISEMKCLLATIKSLSKNLRDTIVSLENDVDLPETQWHEKVKECREMKLKIGELMVKLRDMENVENFRRLVEKRKKKRMRVKKVANQWKVKKLAIFERRSARHATIDAWMREKQNVIECEKQEEMFLKDADMILSEIRGKRSDARKYLAIVHDLQMLRNVKANNARARGEKLSVAADQSFQKIIEQLIKQWSTLDREYATEEQGLKLMLKKDNEKVIAKQKKNNYDDWEIAIFGRKLSSVDSIHKKNINNFIMTRFLWDKYINYEEGTRIPIGWIMPTTVSSAPWNGCLQRV